MSPVAFLAGGFAIAALLCIIALVLLTASESTTWGRITGTWVTWRSKRKRAKEEARAREVLLASMPKAYLVEGGEYEVVSLRDAVARRVK